jgi:hypothetical protein
VDSQIPAAHGEDVGSGPVEAAFEIRRKLRQMTEQMRKALETGDDSLGKLTNSIGTGQATSATTLPSKQYDTPRDQP